MTESVSPILPPLFDPLAGEEDNDDEVLSTILEDEDDEDAILPPIQSCPLSAQDESSTSLIQLDSDLIEVCWRAVARLSID